MLVAALLLARLVSNPDDSDRPEIVYSGRDVTARVRAEQALSMSERGLRAITDNIPAMIARIDKEQRYTFANAAIGRVFRIDPREMIGRTILEVRGERLYAEVKPRVEAALRGEPVSFERTVELDGKLHYYQSNYVPDRDADDAVQGFYALIFDITDLKLAEAELERLARTDSLTGVANRRYFEERFANALVRSHRHGTALSLLCLDIDRFKPINDTHGHPIGDAVIVAVARRMQACVREDDLVARLGGDEFVLLIENPGTESGEIVARKLLAVMQQPVEVDGLSLDVTASVGVAYAAHAPSVKALMDLADQALYSAKQAGRNTFMAVALS